MTRIAKRLYDSQEGREQRQIALDVLSFLLGKNLSFADIESIFETAIDQLRNATLPNDIFICDAPVPTDWDVNHRQESPET